MERRLEVLRDHANTNARSPTDGAAALACSAALERSMSPRVGSEGAGCIVRYTPALNTAAANAKAMIANTHAMNEESSKPAAGKSTTTGASATADAHQNAVVAALGPKLAAQQVLWALRTSTSKMATPHAAIPPGEVALASRSHSSVSRGNREDKQELQQVTAQLKWSLDPSLSLPPPAVMFLSNGVGHSSHRVSAPSECAVLQNSASHVSHASHKLFKRRLKRGSQVYVLGNRLTQQDARSLLVGSSLWFDPVSGHGYDPCIVDTTVEYKCHYLPSGTLSDPPCQVQWPNGLTRWVSVVV